MKNKIFIFSIITIVMIPCLNWNLIGKKTTYIQLENSGEVGYGYTQSTFNFTNYNFLNPTFFFNLVPYIEDNNYIGGIISKTRIDSNSILRNNLLKIQFEYVNTHITSNEIGAGVWGISSGLSFQTGYGNRLSDKFALYLLNNYGLGLNLFFVGNIDNKYDDYESKNDFFIVQSIDHFTFYDQYESKIAFGNPKAMFNIGLQQKLNQKNVVFPTWIVNRIIDLGTNELIELYNSNILKKQHKLLPISNFIIKLALNYLLVELRSSNKNWPFEGEPAFVTRTIYLSFTGFKGGN